MPVDHNTLIACQQCGARFRPTRGHANKYCSHPCYWKAKRTDPGTFWNRVGQPTERGCREWQGARSSSGYGTFRVDGRTVAAHRHAYELTHGRLSPGAEACHTCDNPPCCEPSHLFAGSKRDNQLDKVAKDRHVKGERDANAKLTDAAVRAIRASTEDKHTLAARFGVHHRAIWMVRTYRSWRHVR